MEGSHIPNSLSSEVINQIYMRRSPYKTLMYWFLAVVSLGMFPLFMTWTYRVKFLLMFSECTKEEGTHLLVTADDEGIDRLPIKTIVIGGVEKKMVVFRYIRFFWDEAKRQFMKDDIMEEINQASIKKAEPLTKEKVLERRKVSGVNSLKTPITPILTVLFTEILDGYNIYQFFGCIIWVFRDYANYSAVVVIAMAVTIIMDLHDNRKAQRKLRDMSEIKGRSKVIREHKEPTTIESSNLVPGDRIIIEKGIVAPCDIIVVEGECLVNQAVLTGESVPVFKIEVPSLEQHFNFEKGSKHIIYCGSKVLRSHSKHYKSDAIGFVAKTGFDTLKGQITRGIMYPKRMNFKHDRESDKFLLALLILSLFLVFSYYTYSFCLIDSPFDTWTITIFGIDILLTSLPPGLPLCLLIGISFAVKKLKKKNIYCLSPFLMNAAGRVKTFCFDKTGTLTGSSMEFAGVSIIEDGSKKLF